MNSVMKYKTDQEKFWAGNFGYDYIERNSDSSILSSNVNFFSKSLSRTTGFKSFIEFGSNIGLNIKAINLLYHDIECAALEINEKAVNELKTFLPAQNIYHSSIIDFNINKTWDLVLIKGVLIHIDPDSLSIVYEKITSACNKYLLIAEYYNPTPVSITYRGYNNRLFKRDFAGEVMDKYPDFKLIDYGFQYHRDVNFPQDDITWFLLEKIN